ncbi:hypothetical protein SY88_08430 [Clostridiales bacterium PH28_bin88]|nr:hypothetical protein SY88_08430 [Clostridiales bacterium PH28_bin88]
MAEIAKINRPKLGRQVPLEVFRMLRLVGIRGGLPMGGKSITATVGREIGKNLGCNSLEELLQLLQTYRIGIPSILERSDNHLLIALDDCLVCKGMDNIGEKVCDLEGAIIEGALTAIIGKTVRVTEIKCNCNGDEACVYEVRIY